jgi:predicted methyltransferase
MADEQLEDTNLSSIIVNNLGKNDETNCQCCDTLKVDIQKAKQDILSYKEIIKILLEEQFITRQQQMNLEKMNYSIHYPEVHRHQDGVGCYRVH